MGKRKKDEAEVKGTTITVKEELGKLPPLLGSRSELTEILTNLIFDAVEAMPRWRKRERGLSWYILGKPTILLQEKEKNCLLALKE